MSLQPETVPSSETVPPVDTVPVAVGRRVPSDLRRLFYSSPWMAAVAPVATSTAAYFLAIQVQLLEGNAKVGSLAVVNALASAAAMLTQPIVGVLSDRTRSRFGARRPWMLIGAVIGAVALVTAGLSPNLAVLTVAAMALQFGFNAFQGPFSALMPDRVPERFRGRYATGTGLGIILGAVLGPVVGSLFVDRLLVGYTAVAGIALLAVVVFLLLVPEADNRSEPRRPFAPRAFIAAFWVNPVKYPDFFWGFLGRILLFGSYAMLNTYSLYLAQDYIGLSLAEATRIVPMIMLVSLPGIIIAAAVAGPLSDRMGRRKPIVLVSGLAIALGAVIPFAVPTVIGLTVSTIVVAAGFGAYAAVDQALMSSVLPNPEDHGKDLGVLNIAASLPYTIAPVIAGGVVLATGGYAALYPVVGVVGIIGALAVLPIRGVR